MSFQTTFTPVLPPPYAEFPKMLVNSDGDSVVVESEIEEQAKTAAGFAPAGSADPAAFEHAHRIIEGEPEVYEPQPYPKWIAAAEKIAKDEAEEAKLLAAVSPADDGADNSAKTAVGRPFQKGQSGNPSGRPKKAAAVDG